MNKPQISTPKPQTRGRRGDVSDGEGQADARRHHPGVEWQDPFEILKILDRVEERTPYINVFLQEIERMQELMFYMRKSLAELALGFTPTSSERNGNISKRFLP